MFNNYFSSVYTSDKCADDDTVCQEVEPVMTDLTLTVEEVQAVLENPDSTNSNSNLFHTFTKATGPDNIPARPLKETAPIISPSPCTLFNKSLDEGVLVVGHFAERHFAERHFAERHFAERTFCRRTFCRTDVLPNGHFAERTTCRK